ncbi:MAG: pilus assembly PilX N-terminal domain-containing protein, partial [Gemmatimonadetes bacterium]|nr:pilus assembly PilX N-terminal domain-containing protein [Gemmatimonadota bacterium]
MRVRQTKRQVDRRARDGFAMPAVLFTMVVMSVLAVAAIQMSRDQHSSSQAVRRSAEAFYAAETGLNAVQAEMYDTTSTLDSLTAALSSGGSLDLGDETLPSGATYHAEVMRLDDASEQPLYMITVEAEDASQMGGTREVSLLMTGLRGSGTYVLGGCCKAAATIRGEVELELNQFIDGTDVNPPFWSAPTCEGYTLEDKPALLVDDTDLIGIGGSAFFRSGATTTNGTPSWAAPAVIEDNTIADSTFDDFGGMSWQEVKAQATKTLGNPADPNAV